MAKSFNELIVEVRVNDNTWREVDTLAQAGPQDGVYALDRQNSTIHFGDGQHGRRPETGSSVSVAYRYGAGAAGNVASMTWITPEAGSPVERLFTWQARSGSITVHEHSGNPNTLRWRLITYLCDLICKFL